MDADKPCRCPRCGWLGTIHDAEAYQPLAHLEPLNICPRCATETEVQPLGQKGLDALYREYALLLKGSYQKGFVAQVEKSRYDPYPRRSYPRRSYATAGTATVVGHPSCVNRLSKATRTCNSVT